MPLPYQTSSPWDTTQGGGSSSANPFGNLTSLIGTGIGISNQQQAYSGLQGALNAIGPTQLSSNQLTGPGGMLTGYNPQSGQGSIGLGSLNPAFGGFAGAAGAGAGGYNANLPYGLASGAASTLNPSLQTLFGAYGNYGAGMGAANQQLGNLGNFNQTYGGLLSAMRGQLQPQIQQQAYGLQNTLFGNGVADSTGAASGSLAAQNFGRGVGQADSSAQLAAFQQALGQQQTAGSLYGQLSSSAGGILNNAFSNFGNTNQLISGLNTAGLNNAATAAQGAGALNTMGLNNYNAGLQSSLAAATARNQSLFPYASVATALSGTQNGMGLFGSALSQAGANGGNPLMSLFNTGKSIYNGYNSLFGSGSPGTYNPATSVFSGAPGMTSVDWGMTGGSDLASNAAGATDAGSALWDSGQGSLLDSLGSGGFSSAGGEAAGTSGSLSSLGGPVGNILGIYNGLQQGPQGMISTGTNAAELYNTVSGANDAASGAAGAGSGVAGAAGGMALGAMLAIAAHQNPTAFNQNYWNGLNSTLAAGPGTSQNFGPGGPNIAGIKQYTGYEGAMADLAHADAGQGKGNSTIPDSEWQKLAAFGITPASLAGYNSSWNAAAANMPALMAANDAYGIPNYSKPSSQKK